ncbi:MAG: GNAT family N-acetyltransferase [Candidatus Woesearchaeota archaeon]
MKITINNIDFEIRSCQDEDYQFVYDLLKENMLDSFIKHWGSWNENSFKSDFNKDYIKIITKDGKRIAYYDLVFRKDFAYLHNIQIISSMQGKGIGTYLMNLIEEETKKHNLNKIRLKVFKDNLAMKLYLKTGYKTTKEDESSAIMEKNI